MSAGIVAMLLGLFLVPAYLLWVGHHWNRRSSRQKGAFWGGVTGHTVAALIASAAGLYRPEQWSEADATRGFLGLWLMLIAGIGGIVVGALIGAREKEK